MAKGLVSVCRGIRLAVFDFDGVFTDNRVTVLEDGREAVMCNRSDGLGLQRLRDAHVPAMILSTETNPVVKARARKLRVPCIHGVKDKLAALRAEVRRRRIPLSAVAYLGNDINDSDCLRAVGLPVVVADAWPEVKSLAKWVLKRCGGKGAVREFCDAVWNARRRP